MMTYTLLVFFAIVSGFVAITPAAFADHPDIAVSMPEGAQFPIDDCGDACYNPSIITVDVGSTITWTNDDTGLHTVTSGTMADGADGDGTFGSNFMSEGDTFSHTFDTAGEYQYYCTLHATWMVGTVIVEEAAAEEEVMVEDVEEEVMVEEEPIMMEEAMMSGANLDLDIDPMLPFDNTVNDMVTLSFTAKSDTLKGSGGFDHLDYKVVISKDGNEVWSDQFHDHDANLKLQITPSEGSFTVTGGEEVGSSETKAFMVEGPVFMDNGNYQISGQIVGIEFKPLSTPLVDDFNIEVVPEFGPIVMVTFAIAVVGVIVLTTKSRVIPKL